MLTPELRLLLHNELARAKRRMEKHENFLDDLMLELEDNDSLDMSAIAGAIVLFCSICNEDLPLLLDRFVNQRGRHLPNNMSPNENKYIAPRYGKDGDLKD